MKNRLKEPMAGDVVLKNFATPESLAEAIEKISAACTTLARSGVNRKAVVVLVHDHSRVPKRMIETVLDSLEDLAKKYTTKK